jgi:hypothetical protein
VAEPEILYECDCCERRNVPGKLKGIGYLCEDCIASWTWPGGYVPGAGEPENHVPACPFRVAAGPVQVGEVLDAIRERRVG